MRLSNPDLTEDQRYYKELEKERDEIETELEISRPLINLVDNLVRMGSLYGGQNELIAQEFYKVSLRLYNNCIWTLCISYTFWFFCNFIYNLMPVCDETLLIVQN